MLIPKFLISQIRSDTARPQAPWLREEQPVSKKLSEEVMGKEKLASGQGRLYLPKERKRNKRKNKFFGSQQPAHGQFMNSSKRLS